MVDLVKIRKKAKEKATGKPGRPSPEPTPAPQAAASPEPPPVATAAEMSSKPKSQPAGSSAAKAKRHAESAPAPRAEASEPIPPKTETSRPGAPSALSRTEPATAAVEPTSTKLSRFLETAGERRIETAREAEAAAGTLLELLTFTIAGEFYAVSIENVVEIVTPRAVTRIPNSDPSIVGILSLRGMIVTLIDAHRRLGHGEAIAENPDTRVIVVQLDHETLGFTVDKVMRVVKVDAAAVEPHPVVHASEQDESVRGVFRHADALTILLDLDKLLKAVVVAPAS